MLSFVAAARRGYGAPGSARWRIRGNVTGNMHATRDETWQSWRDRLAGLAGIVLALRVAEVPLATPRKRSTRTG
ncbi:MAG: hypothetical protein NW205_08485 [Hyphomicrobiaceae bacterium]|nr:hypothetical protein [Hyphomicrobiaceae bacterium]